MGRNETDERFVGYNKNKGTIIFKEEIDPKVGLQGFQARKIAFNLGLSGAAHKEMVKFVAALYKAYEATDSSMFEINPVLRFWPVMSRSISLSLS